MFVPVSRPTWHQTQGEYYFYRIDQELCSELSARQQMELKCQRLAEAIGCADQELVFDLVSAGFDEASIEAIQLVPCFAVAWADGCVLAREVDALRQAFETLGVRQSAATEKLFEHWLKQRPTRKLLELWMRFIATVFADQTPLVRRAMAREIIDQTEQIAKAAGGFLGLGNVSFEERNMLDQIRIVLNDCIAGRTTAPTNAC